MARVTVTIHGRKYPIACDDGQEAHLSRLAGYVDKTVDQLEAAIGHQVDEEYLLMMASLTVADELSDRDAELEALKSPEETEAAERAMATSMEKLARRIEGVAERLKRP